MSALATVYQIRSEIEDGPQPGTVPGGISAALTALGFSVITRANAPANLQQARPRLELVCQVGAVTGKKDMRRDGQMVFSAWRFRLSVNCITAPGNDSQNVVHEQFLGTVRAALSTLGQGTWNDLFNFPNVLIAEPLKDTGSQSQLKTEQGVEYTVLNYDGIVMVRPGVW